MRTRSRDSGGRGSSSSWSIKPWMWLFVVLSMLAAACGGADEPATDGEPVVDMGQDSTESGGSTEGGGGGSGSADANLLFTWWGGDARTGYTNEVADLFEEANPSVAISREPTDWDSYWERLAVQAAGGTAPEIISMHPNEIVRYAREGVLAPLDPFIESGALDVSDIPDNILNAGRVDGTLYMVPMGNPYMAVSYDTTLVEEAGLEPLSNDYTWDELHTFLEEWAAASGEGAPWPTQGFVGADQALFSWLLSQGIQPFEEDGTLGFSIEDLTGWFTYWHELQQAGALPPQDVIEEEETPTIEDSMLVRGRVGMQVVPSNQFPTFDELSDHDIEILPMPSGPAGPGHVLLPAGLSVSASASEEEQQTAAEFISFFVNDPEAGAAYQADNGVPPTSAQRDYMIENGVVSEGQQQVFELFDEISEDFPAMNPLPGSTGNFIDALDRYGAQVGFGQMTPQEAAEAFFAEIEPEFQPTTG